MADERQPVDTYDDGRVRIDAQSRVYVGSREVYLTPTEFRLLSLLLRNAGHVLSTRQLIRDAWEDPTGTHQDRVKFAVLRLRRKLGWGIAAPLETLRGLGYRYRAPGKGMRSPLPR